MKDSWRDNRSLKYPKYWIKKEVFSCNYSNMLLLNEEAVFAYYIYYVI